MYAHNHQKNFISGYSETVLAIDKLKSIQTNNTLSIYTGVIHIDCAAEHLEVSKNKISNFLSDIFEYSANDFKKTWEYCNLNQIPLIYLKLSYPTIYSTEIRSLERKLFSDSDQPYDTVDEARNDFLNFSTNISIVFFTFQSI